MQRQCLSGCVARFSRRLALALVASSAVAIGPREAAAAPRDRAVAADAPAPAPEGTRSDGAADYSAGLTLGYVLAPLLALPVGGGLFELTQSDTAAVLGAGLAVVAVPVSIHAFNGEGGRGGASALLLPLVTLGGTAAGGLLGAIIGSAGCDDDSDCELAGGINGAIAGGLIGGLAGYVGYAIYDVKASSSPADHGAPGGKSSGAKGASMPASRISPPSVNRNVAPSMASATTA